jgi:hypothetical protein
VPRHRRRQGALHDRRGQELGAPRADRRRGRRVPDGERVLRPAVEERSGRSDPRVLEHRQPRRHAHPRRGPREPVRRNTVRGVRVRHPGGLRRPHDGQPGCRAPGHQRRWPPLERPRDPERAAARLLDGLCHRGQVHRALEAAVRRDRAGTVHRESRGELVERQRRPTVRTRARPLVPLGLELPRDDRGPVGLHERHADRGVVGQRDRRRHAAARCRRVHGCGVLPCGRRRVRGGLHR